MHELREHCLTIKSILRPYRDVPDELRDNTPTETRHDSISVATTLA